MSNVVFLDMLTKQDISAENMLRNIADEKPKNAFVIVWHEDGKMPTYHSSTGDTPVVLMRLNEFIHKLYNGDFDND